MISALPHQSLRGPTVAARYMFVINPTAGARRRGISELVSIRAIQAGCAFDVAITSGRGDAERIAEEASRDGYDVVVAVGGDGTVNEVGRGLLRHKGADLGIVPTGSGNGVARHLRIPMDPDAAIRALMTAQSRPMDVGFINEQAFFCTAGLGFDAHISRHFAMSKLRGIATYARIALFQYRTYKPTPIIVQMDSIKMETSCFMLAFANANQYGNNIYIAPTADLSDGYLDVCLIDGLPLLRALRVSYALAIGDLPQSGAARFQMARKISVRAENSLEFHSDGEFLGDAKEFDVRIDPLAINVRA